jgi:cell wall-associated NlpC family hydrolase
MTRARLVHHARDYLGVPWRHLGRSRAGVDCIGLVLLAAADAGRPLPDPAPYQREPQGQRLLDGIRDHARRVPSAEPGDILVFRMGLYGGHVGIATDHRTYGGPAVLHAFAPRRHVVEQPMDGEMQRALAAVFRIAEG